MRAIDSAKSEYEEIVTDLEEFFFDLENIKPIDLSAVYIILPKVSRIKKRTILWGFSIAKKANSKVFIVAKMTKKIEEQIEKVSKVMNVEYSFLDEKAFDTDDIKNERNMIIMPRDVVPGMENEKHKGPMVII